VRSTTIEEMDGVKNGEVTYEGSYSVVIANEPMSKLSLESHLENLTNGSLAPLPSPHKDFMYDPSILERISWDKESQAKFKTGISPMCPGEGLILRPLHREDYHKGVLDILSQLTSVGTVTETAFESQFDAMKACPSSYFVTVIEDVALARIIGAATLVVEYKLIHSTGTRGRIEDVVVSDQYRGRHLGKLLLETLTVLGREVVGCYKMSLECKDSLIDFYGQFGYKKDVGNNYLQQRFKD